MDDFDLNKHAKEDCAVDDVVCDQWTVRTMWIHKYTIIIILTLSISRQFGNYLLTFQ